MHPGRDSWSIKAGIIFLWSKHLRNVNENIAHRAKALESHLRQKGSEREEYMGPAKSLFYSHALPPLIDPTLFSNATDSSIPYLTTAQDHLLKFLPHNLIAFRNSIPWTHVHPRAGLSLTSQRERDRESVFETGHSLRMGVISSALPGLSWDVWTAQMCGAKMAPDP